MIDKSHVAEYRGETFARGRDFLSLAPHRALRPYISNYTISFPNAENMADAYTVLPSASSTLVYSLGGAGIVGALRGINTKAAVVGEYANKFSMLLLVEFHPYGLFPFFRFSQVELADRSCLFDQLDTRIHSSICLVLESSESIAELIHQIDRIFHSCLSESVRNESLLSAVDLVKASGGSIKSRDISNYVHYSEKQLNRLFQQQIGTNMKTFSRIVRINRALRLLSDSDSNLTRTAQLAGFHDQAHFSNEFKTFCGITPTAYMENMSIYYKEERKL